MNNKKFNLISIWVITGTLAALTGLLLILFIAFSGSLSSPHDDVTYGKYPRDVYFNLFAFGDALFGRTDVTPAEIREQYNRCIDIKQGVDRSYIWSMVMEEIASRV